MFEVYATTPESMDPGRIGAHAARAEAMGYDGLHVPDALGLGLFTVLGVGFALEGGTTWFIASLLGVVTGTFGGVMGDIICNELPSLFRTAPLYATCSFTGAWVYLGLHALSIDETLAVAMAPID